MRRSSYPPLFAAFALLGGATGLAGRNVLRFDGRLRGRALPPGLYRFVLLPRNRTVARTARFIILPPAGGPRG